MGSPDFKNQIVDCLVDVFNVNVDISRKRYLVQKLKRKSMVVWSQQTEPAFWAKEIIKSYRLPNGGIDVVLIYISLQMND